MSGRRSELRRRRRCGAALASVLLLLTAAPAHAEEPVRRFYGYAYDAASGAYAYTEAHRQEIAGGRWRRGEIDYYAPDGAPLGRKTLEFRDDPYVPLYRMDMLAGYGSALRGLGDPLRVSRTVDGRTTEAELARAPAMCADVGAYVFLRDHFDELTAGRTLAFRFAVVNRLASYRFRARRSAAATVDGRPGMVVRLEPDSLLRLVAGPVEMTLDLQDRRLLEFRGPSNLRDPRGGDARPVRIVYPEAPPPGAPRTLPPLPG